MKEKSIIVAIALIAFFLGCNAQDRKKEADFPELTGSYLGQKPPGRKAIAFASDLLTFEPHDSPIISQDETWMIIGTTEQGLKFFTMNDGKLSLSGNPLNFEIPFSEIPYSYNGMAISASEKKVYFLIWMNNDEDFYAIEKTIDGWSQPRSLGKEVNSFKTHWQFSVSMNENLYFSSKGIKLAVYNESSYLKPIPLILEDNSELRGGTPYIDPDESYIIYSMDNDLHISYKLKNGKWSIPKNLGANINSDSIEICPIISPNGRYLFFITRRNSSDFSIYWADASFIEKLKPKI